MDHRELRRLVRLMNRNGLVEVEIERDGERVHLRKAEMFGGSVAPMQAQHPNASLPVPAAASTAPEVASGPPPGTRDVVSPMVGTFYRRPSPDSEPYIGIGTRIDVETVVCIVEAMKVNNEIKAELAGEVIAILAEDGQPVEYGEPLFRVKVA